MTPFDVLAVGLAAVALFCLAVCAGAAWAGRHLRTYWEAEDDLW